MLPQQRGSVFALHRHFAQYHAQTGRRIAQGARYVNRIAHLRA